jgi:hypothetical protein
MVLMRAPLLGIILASTFAVACSADTQPGAEPTLRVQAPVVEVAILEDPDGNGDQFGKSVALTDTEVFVGQPRKRRVLRFVRSGDGYDFHSAIVPPMNSADFGTQILPAGNWLLVSAVDHNMDPGRIHVFRREGDAFIHVSFVEGEEKVVSFNATSLGEQMMLDGTTLVASGSDGAHVFEFDAGYLTLSEIVGQARGSLAFSGDTLVAGDAFADDPMGGIVRIFRREPSGFTLESSLQPSTTQGNTYFGIGVSLEGDSLLVTQSLGNQLIEYRRVGSQWEEVASLQATSGGYYSGSPFVRRGDVAVVSGGSVALLIRSNEVWKPQVSLSQAQALAVSDDRIALAEPRAYSAYQEEPGRVQILAGLDRALTGSACTESAQCVSGFCVDGVCCNSSCDAGCYVCSVAQGAAEDGTCVYLYAPACCQSDNACKDFPGHVCRDDKCVPECVTDVDCDDSDPCTVDTCKGSRCSHVREEGCGGSGGTDGSGGGVGGTSTGTVGGNAGTGGARNSSPSDSESCACVAVGNRKERPSVAFWFALMCTAWLRQRRRATFPR